MAYFDILVTFVNELDRTSSATNEDWLRIVQADGILGEIPKTNAAFTAWLISSGNLALLSEAGTSGTNLNLVYQQLYDQFFGPCGEGSNGTLMFGIKVLKSRSNLKYNLLTSYGSLKDNHTQEEETEIHIDVDLQSQIEITDHRITKLLMDNKTTVNGKYVFPGVWEGGNPRDKNGDPVTNRVDLYAFWDSDEQTITFSQLMLGTYRLKFMEEYDSYTLTVPPRTNLPLSLIYDIEAIYDATLWGFYSQKYTKLVIEIPDEAKNCPVYYEGTDGNTYIYPGNNYGYDTDGDGNLDGGSTDICACPFCAGTGTLLDCAPIAGVVDCTCPYCDGTGIIPGCRNEEEDTDSEDDGGGYGGQTPSTGICYELHIRRNRCTGEKIDEYLVEVACPEAATTE